jgi:hypothetical protein
MDIELAVDAMLLPDASITSSFSQVMGIFGVRIPDRS